MKNEHREESILEFLILKIAQNENDIKQAEQLLNDIKLRNRKVLNVLSQKNKEENCNHIWLELHGHPAALECKKCGKLEKST